MSEEKQASGDYIHGPDSTFKGGVHIPDPADNEHLWRTTRPGEPAEEDDESEYPASARTWQYTVVWQPSLFGMRRGATVSGHDLDLCEHEAWLLAFDIGYVLPRWWQFWRWLEVRPPWWLWHCPGR